MDDYKKIYQTLLEPFQERLWSHEMTSCPVIVGSNYETSPFRMLYVGRAVNSGSLIGMRIHLKGW